MHSHIAAIGYSRLKHFLAEQKEAAQLPKSNRRQQ